MVAGKRTGAAKGSRHNKKYWRKGTDITDIEDAIHVKSREAATGGIIDDMKDEDIFTVDRTSTSKKSEEPKLTRKQQAALDKITRNITIEKTALPKPTGKVLKKPAKLPRGNASVKPKKAKVVKKKEGFDVWTTDLTPTIPKNKTLDNEMAAEHYLKIVKKKQPKAPGKAITTLLPAVEVAQGGASYNPESAEYEEYVGRIAREEQKLIDSEEKTKRGIEPQWEKVTTDHERFLEMAEGLRIHPKFNEEEEAETSEVVEEATVKNAPVSCERLTKEQKKKKAKAQGIEKEEKRRLEEKAREKDAHNVYRTKQIHKELDDEEKERHEESEARKKKKVLNKLTKRQKLGRGKFVDAEDPFLLQEELTGNLRQIKPQGHVLDDRMKSLQRRNMLPIGGNKAKKLKTSLKHKIVEKRNVKAVVKGSRVI
uniref:Ribosome biogenesis protein NOP53 n=1 Tax=Caenorhabditis tropicalis TaxID=1561998 RepID=A0A1I7T6A6_9PELO